MENCQISLFSLINLFLYDKILLVIGMSQKYIETNLKKKELQDFLQTIKIKSQTITIERYYEGYMSIEEFEHMQSELKQKITHDYEKRIHDYQNNIEGYRDEMNNVFHFLNDEEANSYFQELFNQDMDVYNEYQYCEFEHQKNIKLDIPDDVLIERRLTRISPVSVGPVFEILTLSVRALETIMPQMKKLFSSFKVYGGEFEDLCCYDEKGATLLINSHEGYAIVEK